MASNTTRSNNTIKTRIQLKSDTEANWNKAGPKEGSNGFVPLQGELIVYIPDATHPFSRLKIGDGSTNVVSLPFINSEILNGITKETVGSVNWWLRGIPTTASVENHTLKIVNGVASDISWGNKFVVTNITEGA